MVVELVEELPPPVSMVKEEVLAMAPTSTTSSLSISFSTISSVTSAVSVRGVSFGMVSAMVICVLSISGIKAVPLEKAASALVIRSTSARIRTTGLNRKASPNSFS